MGAAWDDAVVSDEPLLAVITAHVVAAGRSLLAQAGTLPDIGGARKEFLTSEDLRIERELSALITAASPGAVIWGEELHDDLPDDLPDDLGGRALTDLPDVWVLDPISSTQAFLRGTPHYAVVVTHLAEGSPDAAVVYDPSVDELFTARRGRGAFCNGRRLAVSAPAASPARTRIAALLAPPHVGTPAAARWWQALAPYDVVRPVGSYAVAYAWVAAGRYDGVLAHTKDAFCEFAAALLIAEAGGTFLAGGGRPPGPRDRWFYGGSAALLPTVAALAARLQTDDDPPTSVERAP